MKNTQKGFSPLEIILIIFVVILVGIMGYLGYRQLTKSEPLESVKSNYVKKAEVEKFSEEYSGKGAGKTISLKYPKSWKYEKAPETAETLLDLYSELTGPDSDVIVRIYLSQTKLTGIGGYCAPEENPTFTKVEHTALKNAPGFYLMVSELSNYSSIDQVVDQKLKDVSVQGANQCVLDILPFMLHNEQGDANIAIYSTSLKEKNDQSQAITSAELNDYHNSNDFKTAQEIVKTLKVEN